jgi:SAM-dependent methyltransferase
VSDRWEDLPAGAFGLVTLHHVLEHLPNPIEVLADLRGRLAADGRLLVEVPNARSLRARLAAPWLCRRFGADERYRAYPIHLMYYSSRTLRQMLETSGWAVETMFTAGLGIDELFVPSAERRGRPDGPEVTGPSGRENGIARLGERPWRHGLRAAFLGLGAGENLAVIASAGKIKK